MENFKTIPKQGDFVNILEHNGILDIINTSSKNFNSNTHQVIDCYVKDNQLFIKAVKAKYIDIDKNIIDNGKDYIIFKSEKCYFNDIIKICYYQKDIVRNYYFKSIFSKIFNKKAIEYKYIIGYDGWYTNEYLTKPEYWDYIEYQTNNFLLTYK